jgi:hypothetical protein
MRTLAEAGNVEAMMAIVSAAPSREEEEKWLAVASSKGNPRAAFIAAGRAEFYGAPMNRVIALYERASQLGSKDASRALGEIYEYGKRGVGKNYSAALHWYLAGDCYLGAANVLETSSRRDDLIEAYKYRKAQQLIDGGRSSTLEEPRNLGVPQRHG